MGDNEEKIRRFWEEQRRKQRIGPGTTLDRYVLEDMIYQHRDKTGPGAGKRRVESTAQGDMKRTSIAAIFRARDTNSGQSVAMKVVRRHNMAVDEAMQVARMRREIDVLRKYSHPNIVRLIHAGETDACLFYAMDLIEGKDLWDIIDEQGYLEPRRVITMAKSIASALYPLHREGIFHRDLTPANIMVEHPGIGERYILIDFGIVKLIYAQDPKLTGRNVLLGTEGYRPPEQIADKHFDARSDVYSLSAVMYTMLSGLPPFTKLRDENTGDFLNRVQTEDPECLLRLRKGLDPVLAEIVMAGMSKDPGKRCQDCGRLIATLEWYERAYLS